MTSTFGCVVSEIVECFRNDEMMEQKVSRYHDKINIFRFCEVERTGS